MRITIFGASGRAGLWITQAALDNGNFVTAVMRDPSKLEVQSDNLVKVQADVRDADAVRNALKNADAVISAVGDRNLTQEISLMSITIENILKGMKAENELRLIALSGDGILQENENRIRAEREDFPSFLKHVSEDHLKVYKLLVESNIDWTLVCPPQIIPAGPLGSYKFLENYYPGGKFLHAGDLANFVIKELGENKFIRKRVGISN